MNDDNLHIETSSTGAKINTLQIGSKHFFYPQQFIDKDAGIVLRGGMHICSPVFGSPEGKGIFSQAPQHGELRDYPWEGHATSKVKPKSICYSNLYTEWGTNLLYSVRYLLESNQLTVYTDIRNCGSETNDIELGWHPYLNSPKGGVVKFSGRETPDIVINEAYGPNVFPACDRIEIELNGIGTVTMELEDGFNTGFVCIWTDWRRKYFCVEPLLSYKKHSKGIAVAPGKNVLTKFVMTFRD
jgi:galactose mutarotase-like enzyme